MKNITDKQIIISEELKKLSCSNPDCEKNETRVNFMAHFTIAGGVDGSKYLSNISFTEKICCERFRKEIEDKYNHLRQYLTFDNKKQVN